MSILLKPQAGVMMASIKHFEKYFYPGFLWPILFTVGVFFTTQRCIIEINLGGFVILYLLISGINYKFFYGLRPEEISRYRA